MSDLAPASGLGHDFGSRSWMQAWKSISAEQCAGAAILGLVAVSPTLIGGLQVGPIASGWDVFARQILRTEVTAFLMLLAIVQADRAADQGSRRVLVYGIAVVAAAIAGAALSAAWDQFLPMEQYILLLSQVNPHVFYTHYVYLVIEWVLIGALTVYVYVDRRDARAMMARLHEASLRRSAQAKTMLESQLQTLQARVEPQFLFQTLARVRMLYETNATGADRMLDELIVYLRCAMPRMRDTAAELAQELTLAEAWVTIVHGGAPLLLSIDCDEHARRARVPAMLLLPLIGGMLASAPDHTGSALRVRARVERDRLVLEIALEVDAPRIEPVLSATATLRERLAALFGAASTLCIEATRYGIEARLEIPYETPNRADR
jgi:hypothetical protein